MIGCQMSLLPCLAFQTWNKTQGLLMNKKLSKPNSSLTVNCNSIRVYNLEKGMPSLEAARKNLLMILETEKRRGTKAIKIIHGYGSSGKGGVLKQGLRQLLLSKKNEGNIKDLINGENFLFSNAMTNTLIKYPGLMSDSDFNRANSGITIILIS